MTHVYCVRHAQPVSGWTDNRTRPLSEQGKRDSETLADALKDLPIDAFVSSPFVRSVCTIQPLARARGMTIETDERFAERAAGKTGFETLRQRWDDFSFAEPGGESHLSVQQRNVPAFEQMLQRHQGQSVVLGTHATALAMIRCHYQPSYDYDHFMRMFPLLPYVVRLDFDQQKYVGCQEVFMLNRGY